MTENTAVVTDLPEFAEAPTSLKREAWRRLRANKIAVFGLVVVAILAFVALFGPWLTPFDFLTQDLASRNLPPSLTHWLGTDDLGRDVASRLIYGTRTAFLVAIVVTAISVVGSMLWWSGSATPSCRCRTCCWSSSSTPR